MSKLEQFDKIINGFEQELDRLQNTSKVYQKINELYNQNLQIINFFKENTSYLKQISDTQIQEQENVLKFLREIETQQQKSYAEVQTLLAKIGEQSKEHKEELAKTLDKNFETITRENKDSYKDLADILKIKLENSYSEIKRLIENERLQIKELFEKISEKQADSIKIVIKEECQKIEKLQQSIYTLLCISFLIILIVLFIIIYKLS
ncbi:hypothetical protein [Capnocytophaga leadbetteri]|jgi:hypothetical protein|uniref:hypothetical protein n=1 Tax=Capnocytophaga leadbetteri TaxID=327575 RepID=UPI0028D63EB6|nr:hypothetical protein [Capnocytophaga leadbetteri]